MKTFGVNAAVVIVSVVIMLLLGEATLRLFPSLIDVAVLDRFHPSLRREVAYRLTLPTDMLSDSRMHRSGATFWETPMPSVPGSGWQLYVTNCTSLI